VRNWEHLGAGCSAARLARLLRKQEVGSSNLPTPTKYFSVKQESNINQFRSSYLIIFVLCVIVIVSQSSIAATPQAAHYPVRSGDSISLIAQRFGTTVKTIKKDNALQSDLISVGQNIVLSKPFRGKNQKAIWHKVVPHPGPVLRPFGPYKANEIIMPRTGVEIAGATGTRLFSPAIGVVRHSGPMDGFGHLLIIEHVDDFVTVIAPCDPQSIEVKVGQAILAGDLLGLSGPPPDLEDKPYLHLELRRGDKAIKPDRLFK
jgi:murein DD-endopeptidase MepM/ murein hydrolase activator NlpD